MQTLWDALFEGKVSACLPLFVPPLPLLRIPRLCQLLNVVHHAVQIPLRIDLLAPTVVEVGQPLVVPYIGKHRLHGTNALAESSHA
jgi:hypothetical protein